jgi:hypothetical protein
MIQINSIWIVDSQPEPFDHAHIQIFPINQLPQQTLSGNSRTTKNNGCVHQCILPLLCSTFGMIMMALQHKQALEPCPAQVDQEHSRAEGKSQWRSTGLAFGGEMKIILRNKLERPLMMSPSICSGLHNHEQDNT